MQNRLRSFFAPPVFPEDEEKTRSAFYINALVLTNVPIFIFFAVARIATGAAIFSRENLILLSISLFMLAMWFVMRSGRVALTSYIYIGSIWIAITAIAFTSNGLRGMAFNGYFLIMLIAGLLLGWRPAVGIAVLSMIASFGMSIAENNGLIEYQQRAAIGLAIEATVLLSFGAIFLILIINTLQNTIKKEKEKSDELNKTVHQLTELQEDLESRIAQRTIDLETQQADSEKRSRQFEAITGVTQAISATRSLKALLPKITSVISDQFGFYHAGIFLNDSAGQYAVLSAANSDGGQRMLARGHQLKVGAQGIVGTAVGSGKPRIALDTGKDAVYFDNPDLPETRSEMALPLRNEDKVIGALDVQSTERNAFSDQDIEVLSILANQVSLAIVNAQVFERSQRALAEAESITRQYLRDTWSQLPEELKFIGYRHNLTSTELISSEEDIRNAVVPENKKEISVPIDLRGETIGTLTVQIPKSENVNRDKMDLIKAVAERVAFSVENARLFDETSRRAQREQLVTEITTKIRSTTDPDEMIKIALEELKQTLKVSRVEIVPQRISPPDN